VEIKGEPKIKLSNDMPKISIPGRKKVYRLFGKDGSPLVDYMALADEDPPKIVEKLTCRHPFDTQHRLVCKPSAMLELHSIVFQNGRLAEPLTPFSDTRTYIENQIETFPANITRYKNPETYRMMVSLDLYEFLHKLWERQAPIEVVE
jgi:nicotinate phosphoribosyltransferase